MGFKIPIIDVVAGTTFKLTWVNSGVTPGSISGALIDKDETLVNSASMVDSGNGHYYLPLYLPRSFAWYVAQAVAVIDSRTYVSRALVKGWKIEAN